MPLVVSDPLNTRWSYAGSKGLVSKQLSVVGYLGSFLDQTIYMDQDKIILFEFIHRAIGGDYNLYGGKILGVGYILMIIDALIKLIHTKKARGEIINIGSNEERKVIILAEIILKHLGIDKNLLAKKQCASRIC